MHSMVVGCHRRKSKCTVFGWPLYCLEMVIRDQAKWMKNTIRSIYDGAIVCSIALGYNGVFVPGWGFKSIILGLPSRASDL